MGKFENIILEALLGKYFSLKLFAAMFLGAGAGALVGNEDIEFSALIGAASGLGVFGVAALSAAGYAQLRYGG